MFCVSTADLFEPLCRPVDSTRNSNTLALHVGAGENCMTLTFDDVATGPVPSPYHGLIFAKSTSGSFCPSCQNPIITTGANYVSFPQFLSLPATGNFELKVTSANGLPFSPKEIFFAPRTINGFFVVLGTRPNGNGLLADCSVEFDRFPQNAPLSISLTPCTNVTSLLFRYLANAPTDLGPGIFEDFTVCGPGVTA